MAKAVSSLPSGVAVNSLEFVLSVLDHVSVLCCSVVTTWWRQAGDSFLVWGTLCDHYWSSKVYVPKSARDLRMANPKKAFRDALVDSSRTHIRLEELAEFNWWHRLKASAGAEVTTDDPWWTGEREHQPVLRYRADRSCVWRAAASGSPATTGTWRFVHRCCHRLLGPWGVGSVDAEEPRCFGRFLRGRPQMELRETPTKVVFRHPDTWGFILDSCWSVQTSWPMPARGSDPLLEDAGLMLSVENMRVEANRYNTGQEIDNDDPDPLAEDDDAHSYRFVAFL